MDDVPLTEQESEIMRILAVSKTPRQISEQIGVTVRIVEHDIARLRVTLHVRDVAALRTIARERTDRTH